MRFLGKSANRPSVAVVVVTAAAAIVVIFEEKSPVPLCLIETKLGIKEEKKRAEKRKVLLFDLIEENAAHRHSSVRRVSSSFIQGRLESFLS